jgi:hypothetical protein
VLSKNRAKCDRRGKSVGKKEEEANETEAAAE